MTANLIPEPVLLTLQQSALNLTQGLPFWARCAFEGYIIPPRKELHRRTRADCETSLSPNPKFFSKSRRHQATQFQTVQGSGFAVCSMSVRWLLKSWLWDFCTRNPTSFGTCKAGPDFDARPYRNVMTNRQDCCTQRLYSNNHE